MDNQLHDWPEPVVSVQSLADSGLTALPDRYIKPPSDRPTTISDKLSTQTQTSIPVIDLSGLLESAGECRATIRTISGACREWGFFQVVNHGVAPELLERVRRVWRSFFELPLGEKQAYANTPRTYEGYGSRLGVEKGAVLDWGDYFYLHLLPECIKDYAKWPASPAYCRETIDEFGVEVTKLCGLLMKVLSIGLGLDVDYLQRAFGSDQYGACMRVNYYPKCPEPDLTLGLSAHSDPGGLTVLLADEHVKALQVRKGDSWVTVQPVPNAFIVNIGDQIQVLSNATYKSIEHRVLANSETDRVSLALFYNPKSDLLLSPAPELISLERPPLYQPMTFSEYRMFIRRNGPKGKTQVESLKAM